MKYAVAMGPNPPIIPNFFMFLHVFHDELQDEVGLPVMNAVEETAVCLWNRGIKHVGIYILFQLESLF